MSANTVPAGSNGAPIHRGEHLLTPGYASSCELRVPATMEGPKRSDRSVGAVWLTDQRVIYVTRKPTGQETNDGLFGTIDDHPTLTSVIIPYATIRNIEFKLPLFAPNHMNIHFGRDHDHLCPNLPETGSEQDLVVKMVVGNGLGHNLYKRIEKERAAWKQRQRDEDFLPEYTPAYVPTPPASPPPPADAPGTPPGSPPARSGMPPLI